MLYPSSAPTTPCQWEPPPMPMTSADVKTFADALIAARCRNGTPAALPGTIPANPDDAYKIQDLVAAEFGANAGWKVGAANPTSEPFCAPVLAGGIIEAGPSPIQCPATTGIEVEIAFRMAKAFPASAKAPSEADVIAAIGSAHVAMELCASRLATGAKSPPMANLADNGLNLAFVLGPRVADWRAIYAAKQIARAIVGGKTVVETTGGHSQKNLTALLVWQVGHVVTRRGGLAAGAVIATGSWTGLHWTSPPATVGGEFPGVGRMDIALAL